MASSSPLTVLAVLLLLSSSRGLSSPVVVDRRKALVAAAAICWSRPEAAATADAGETIRRGASNLPGYGPSDVFYPTPFKGKWKLVREQVSPETRNMEYEVRFIQSLDQSTIVADRGYNQAALEKSASQQAVQSFEWAETNPNDLRLVLENGRRKEIKVTKRASDRTDDTLSSSEFQRVTQEDARGIPVIVARRVLTKYKVVNDGTIEGLELVYDMGGGGDPLAGASPSNQPQLLSKSRLHLTRLQ